MPLNLVQIKERLKGMPIQAIMAYANGSNRMEVPPDMALGELLRRKEMQENAQMPQGTVKDRIEQSVLQDQMALMQTQAAKMQANAQQQQAAAAQVPSIPPGTPEPVQMARGGVTSLPSRFNFAPGGIVAFAGAGSVGGEFEAETSPQQAALDELRVREEARKREEKKRADMLEFLERAGAPQAEKYRDSKPPEAEQEKKHSPPEVKQRPPATRGVTTEIAPREPSMMELAREFFKTKQTTPPEEKAAPGSLASRPAYTDFEQFLKTFEQSQGERDRAALEREARRQQAEFLNSLIEGAEASRGQRGFANIGAIMGGIGKSLGTAQVAALDRADKLAEVERDRQMKMAEYRMKIEEARRAEERGDLKARNDRLMEAAKIEREIARDKATLAANLAQTEEMAKTRAATAAAGSRDSLDSIAANLRRENPKLSYQQSMEAASRIKFGASFERTSVANMEAFRKAVEKIDARYPLLQAGGDSPKIKDMQAKRDAEVRREAALYGIGGDAVAAPPKIDTSTVRNVTQTQ